MAKAKKKAAKRGAGSRAAAVQQDAIALLKADHRQVEEWFEQFESTRSDDRKQRLAQQCCQALKVHTQIEEEIFYPQARKATKDDDLLDEAIVEHAGAKELIAQIESMKVVDDLYDAKVKVLGEQVKHHIKEEEEELFPEVEGAKMDLAGLGKTMAARKLELMTELPGKQSSGRSGTWKSKVSADRAAAGDKPSTAIKPQAGDEE